MEECRLLASVCCASIEMLCLPFVYLKKTHAGEKDGRLRAKFLYPNLKRMQGLHFAHQGNGALNGSSGRSLSPQTTLKKDGANDAEEHLHLPPKKTTF